MLANKVRLKHTNINNNPFILQHDRLNSNKISVFIIKYIYLTEPGLLIISVQHYIMS